MNNILKMYFSLQKQYKITPKQSQISQNFKEKTRNNIKKKN